MILRCPVARRERRAHGPAKRRTVPTRWSRSQSSRLEEGIRASGYVRNALDNERREAEADGLTLLVLRLRERIRERMLGGMQGVTVGWRAGCPSGW